MKFFEQQKIDDIGILGVKLQKILIFLSIVNIISYIQFSMLSWGCGLAMQVILGSAIYGAYKRRICLLRFYVAIQVILIILGIVVVAFFLRGNEANDPGYDVVVNPDPMTIQPVNEVPLLDLSFPLNKPLPLSDPSKKILPLYFPKAKEQLIPVSIPKPVLNLHPSHNKPTVPTMIGTSSTTPVSLWILAIALVIVAIVLFALKIATIVMAAKMARLLVVQRASNLAHPVVKSPPKTNTASAPQHQQVMYVPINMAQQPMNPSMMNPGMMNPGMMNPGMMNPGMMYPPYMQPVYPMYNPYLQPQFQGQYPQVQFGNPRQQV